MHWPESGLLLFLLHLPPPGYPGKMMSPFKRDQGRFLLVQDWTHSQELSFCVMFFVRFCLCYTRYMTFLLCFMRCLMTYWPVFPPAVLFVYIPQQGRRPLPYPIRVILVLWRRLSIHALLISFVWIRSSVGVVVRARYLLLFVCLFLLSMLDVLLPDVMIVLWMWLINTRMIIDAWAIV